ncbi:tetratricopeptide repeat protein [Singulisphaera acidiphila]|uniref:Tetratricopeptide repeat protein n=1 Tax=Singulisphaera acidiphila (strain ATCC BAA-1392 / DSM 18658 / VKM B-2454 / MOB10) TaxID=886293 RepID=L0D6V0_SINAD|nr:hypothetical protein [Singulisphaera acidiphila]AGA24595.1 hypothetical protein Sinac_0137 [Singulisphaera acidiphila DSM 18658]
MSKHKDRKRAETKQAPAQGSPRQEVERLIRKGWFKDAVKQAKLCYRNESTPENHHLLERAYFLRAQQLHREAMPTSAVEVTQHLLEFGVTDPDLPSQLVPLLLAVGLSNAAMAMGERLESPEDRARLILSAADQAVLDPKRAPASLTEIREGSALIRGALETLDAGDEAGALDRLRSIARSSPFADWRYFVRGLAALRRRDDEQVAANWGRLDTGRAAARIAQTLGSLIEKPTTPTLPATATAAAPNLKAIEAAVFGEPLIPQLEQLQQCLNDDRWDDAIPLLIQLRFSLRRIDPRLAERLTRILLWPLIDQAAQTSSRAARQLVGSFVKAAEPLPIDPRWNRLRAIIAEGPHGDYEESEKFWYAYLEDLKTLPTLLSPEERQRAQALVWAHLAHEYAEAADPNFDDLFDDPPTSEDLEYAKKRTIECLEASLQADPTFLTGYNALIHTYEHWNQADRAEAAANRLLTAFPNHFETLLWLINRHFRQDQHDKAIPLIQRARVLKPLDEALRELEWSGHVALGRHHALKKRWDEGRAEFTLAEAVGSEQSKSYLYMARKAVFELKAGQADRAEEFIEAAQKLLVEPTPLWLAILIEGARYGLPKATLERFNPLWEAGLAKKGKSETAGALTDLLMIYLDAKVSYTGWNNHVHQVVGYLKRSSRVHFRRDDLINICTFLHHDSVKAKELLEKLAKRGLKNFPDYAGFPFMVAVMEFAKGPRKANLRQVRKDLEKALQLAQTSSNPRESQLIPTLKKLMSTIEAITSRQFSSPFGMPFPGFGGRGGFPQTFADMFAGIDMEPPYEMIDDDEGEDDVPLFGRRIDPGPSPAGPSQSPPKNQTTKKAKPKKKR